MLRRIKVRYDSLEDRLLLSLETSDRAHHLLLTRRVWGSARPALQRLLTLSAAVPASLPAGVQHSISAVHHQALAAQQASSRETVALAGAPEHSVLVCDLKLGQRKTPSSKDGARPWIIVFSLHQQPELRLVLNDATLHGLVSALLEREEAAAWGLPALPARIHAPPLERKPTLQ